jgi:inner membrane protein
MLAGAVVLANVPDLDFLPGLLIGEPSAFHRGITHTVLGVAVATALFALLLPRLRVLHEDTPPWGGWVFFVFVALASHLLVDVVSIDTRPPPNGTMVLWPFSDHRFYFPFTGLGDIPLDRQSRVGFLRSLWSPEALLAWGREVVLLVATVSLVHAARGVAGLRQMPAKR